MLKKKNNFCSVVYFSLDLNFYFPVMGYALLQAITSSQELKKDAFYSFLLIMSSLLRREKSKLMSSNISMVEEEDAEE